MEVISFPGYTAVEKFEIAKKYLLPNAMSVMGLKKQNLKVTDDAMREIINEYTMESGVRGLKKQMETLCRQAAVKLVKGEQKSISVGVKRLKEFLGRKKIHHDVRMQDRTGMDQCGRRNPVYRNIQNKRGRESSDYRSVGGCDEGVRADCIDSG